MINMNKKPSMQPPMQQFGQKQRQAGQGYGYRAAIHNAANPMEKQQAQASYNQFKAKQNPMTAPAQRIEQAALGSAPMPSQGAPPMMGNDMAGVQHRDNMMQQRFGMPSAMSQGAYNDMMGPQTGVMGAPVDYMEQRFPQQPYQQQQPNMGMYDQMVRALMSKYPTGF